MHDTLFSITRAFKYESLGYLSFFCVLKFRRQAEPHFEFEILIFWLIDVVIFVWLFNLVIFKFSVNLSKLA